MFGDVTWLGGKPANAGIFQVASESAPAAQPVVAQSSRLNVVLWGVAILGGGGLLLYALLRK